MSFSAPGVRKYPAADDLPESADDEMARHHREDQAAERAYRDAARALRTAAEQPRARDTHLERDALALADRFEAAAAHIVAVWD